MIRVVIADDHDLIRDGFKKLAGHEGDIAVVGDAAVCSRDRRVRRILYPAQRTGIAERCRKPEQRVLCCPDCEGEE